MTLGHCETAEMLAGVRCIPSVSSLIAANIKTPLVGDWAFSVSDSYSSPKGKENDFVLKSACDLMMLIFNQPTSKYVYNTYSDENNIIFR